VSHSSKARFITLAELCEMLDISKSRFYALQKKGIFPAPQRAGNRPVFDQSLSQQCVEIVRSRVGLNGEPVLFNRKAVEQPSRTRPDSAKGKHDDMIAALQSLGVTATADQVAAALKTLPNAGAGMEEPEKIRAVFLHLRKAAG
jgi:predicted DNA-binding transcriptional regulator AlpA